MSDNPFEPAVEASANPAPNRNKGKFARSPEELKAFRRENLRKGREKAAAKRRDAPPRTAESRTVKDTPAMAAAPSPIPSSRMPRDSGSFSPEYDGPTDRVSRVDRDTNQFELPAALRTKMRNAGWDGTYKVVRILNQPVDGTELLVAANAGWRPAKAKDFPELVPPGTPPEDPVDRFGQRLYIRPAHMTRAAQIEDERFANAQMQSRITASKEGRSVRSDEESLADMGRVVRPVHIALEVEGESGTHGPR